MWKRLKSLFTCGERDYDMNWELWDIYDTERVPCACGTEAVELEPCNETLLWVYFWYRGSYPTGLWGRIKGACRLIYRGDYMFNEVTLDVDEAVKLADFIYAWRDGGKVTHRDIKKEIEEHLQTEQ